MYKSHLGHLGQPPYPSSPQKPKKKYFSKSLFGTKMAQETPKWLHMTLKQTHLTFLGPLSLTQPQPTLSYQINPPQLKSHLGGPFRDVFWIF